MFRLSRYISALLAAERGSQAPASRHRPAPIEGATRPVVIWNLIRRCNLTCQHCYSLSADKDFAGELSTDEIYTVMDDLKAFGVPVLILSGGEPLLHPDIIPITRRAHAMGFYVGLSTNGTLITADVARDLATTGVDYVGISLDGLEERHNHFRRQPWAFERAMNGVRLCRDHGLKVGLRFCPTQDTAEDLPALLNLADRENIDKIYITHLNYAGRGKRNRERDAQHDLTRKVMDLLFDRCLADLRAGKARDYVTGNNDADGVYLLHWATKHFPAQVPMLHRRLRAWGGNASGVGVANIDNLGQVHPDTMWWTHSLGSVRDTPFSQIWTHTADPLMLGLRQRPRPVTGRCATCGYLDVCNGNTRTRALQTTGDPWAEDPGCYLTDAEIHCEGETAP